VDPDDGLNSNYRTLFDPGTRTVQVFDANGNPESYAYDAANRTVTVTDALGNLRAHSYDANSNLISVSETELPGPGAGGAAETYVTTFVFDEINRRTEQHIRGLNGRSIDHAWLFAYDSRNNQRLGQDAENNFTRTTFDDADRTIIQQRFDDDPLIGSANELLHYEWAYDRNSRVVQERALSDVTDAASAEITRHAYDALDRRVRTVFPDSDDPIDGSGNGPDGIFDRLELTYDPNSNLIRMVDQREVVFDNTFDPGNRLTIQEITRTPTVPGTSRQVYVFDSLNRIASAGNNFALVEQSYDPLSRLTREKQSISLDGSGFTRGWENPIQLVHAYDKQSNKTLCQVLDGARSDLAVSTTFDALNRTARIAAQYFDAPVHDIATYVYLGPWRVQTKMLGNGAALTRLYDVKRRPRAHQWTGPAGLLVGFEYDYDRMDNVLFERFTHDNGLFDHFLYNDRYEVIGVEYRAPGATPPVNPRTRFFYDDVFNRTQASFGDPFETQADTLDSYTANQANEYTQIRRNGRAIDLAHDRAGNMTRLLLQPVTNGALRSDALATARWDAFNLLYDIDTGVTPKQDYRYDSFRRRIATLELDGPNGDQIQPGSRRFIYCGWDDVEERLFDSGATLASAPSRLERIYVNGREIDEPLLTAIDTNGDGKLGGSVPKNLPDVQADQEYYFLNNRLGSIMALLDADQGDRVLEYYRYSVYGEPTALQAIDLNRDRREDTPFNLVDNSNLRLARAQSAFGNVNLFAARRFDSRSGLYHCRNRYYEPSTGRFLSRDPIGYTDAPTLYAHVRNNPVNLIDPWGLDGEPAPSRGRGTFRPPAGWEWGKAEPRDKWHPQPKASIPALPKPYSDWVPDLFAARGPCRWIPIEETRVMKGDWEEVDGKHLLGLRATFFLEGSAEGNIELKFESISKGPGVPVKNLAGFTMPDVKASAATKALVKGGVRLYQNYRVIEVTQQQREAIYSVCAEECSLLVTDCPEDPDRDVLVRWYRTGKTALCSGLGWGATRERKQWEFELIEDEVWTKRSTPESGFGD
jgi:RHS repeat-associated protein